MKKVISLLLLCVVMLTGCAKKEFLYLADMTESAGYVVANRHQSSIQSDDRLKITVSCKNPELAAPFNVSTGNVKVSSSGQVSAVANNDANTYRVNIDGEINFPILGMIHVAGLSLQEASDKIRDLIILGNYIKDPIVTTEFLNFHYTVLGAVGSNGTYSVDGDKVTILEAIAKSGDLTAEADLHRIAVIREADGERKIYSVDITSTDIFNSPAFYLAQNDIIYARPKKAKGTANTNYMTWITLALSVITAGCTVAWAIKR
ncbi:polysaccharide biosynthesis/export family protein [uncultured Duncaniella sp.]|uniref:polysaccharide biosynthesis/export family protein n=1 Tax=uncultured Duncaniella sp. TaxID=2768039 RepID=UPI002677145F|nr:polysaccharide biosynthesis/export family protein [uncultured Duncaniella sp.]